MRQVKNRNKEKREGEGFHCGKGKSRGLREELLELGKERKEGASPRIPSSKPTLLILL